jgi:hypothetical protein
MAVVYLVLSVIGYLVPGVLMIRESLATGNILFWTQPSRTTAELFANATSTTFALDLAGVVVVALIWMTVEARRLGMRRIWAYWVLAFLFGLAGTLPLFLSSRERRIITN